MGQAPQSTATGSTAPAVARSGPLALFAAGREAFAAVPGLRGFVLRGFVLLYAVFAAVGAVMVGLVYRYAVQPLAAGLEAYEADGGFWWDLLFPLLTGLLWLGQMLLLAATLLVAFVISLSLLSVWFEALAARIMAHVRGQAPQEAAFSLGGWVRSLGRALRDNVLLLALAVVSLLVGFVPLVGPVLVFGIGSFLMGWEVREPYLAVRAGLGEELPALRRGLTLWTLGIGTLPVVLAMVPWLGWLLLPVLLVYMVAGLVWRSEGGAATD